MIYEYRFVINLCYICAVRGGTSLGGFNKLHMLKHGDYYW